MTAPASSPENRPEDHVLRGDPDRKGRRITPLAWVPSVNFAQGLQYAIVVQLILIVFFTMGLPLGDTLFWVGLLQLPWVLKPLWGPLIDRYWTKRSWTIAMQGLVGLSFAATAGCLLLPGETELFGTVYPNFFLSALVFLFLVAFAAATHDIACDGFYMMGLSQRKQAFYVGVRSTAFRIALIFANGILLWGAGYIQDRTGLPSQDAEVRVLVDAEVPPLGSQLREAPPPGEGQAIIIDPPQLLAAPGESTSFTVRLADPPRDGRQVVVLFRFVGGESSISVQREHERLVFNGDNWEEGISVPVSVDERIRMDSSAQFRATAGNIPFSWAVVLLVSAAVFGFFFLFHQFAMPHPASDRVYTEPKPFFLVPVFWLFVTIAVPWAFFYGVFHFLLGALREPFTALLYGVGELTSLQEKGLGFKFNAVRFLVLILLGLVLLRVGTTSRLLLGGFRFASRRSGVGFAEVFETFFGKKRMLATLGFLLTFRLGEAQLAQVKNPFLIDSLENQGIAMTLGQLGFSNSAVYLVALTVGGLIGGFIIARFGLRQVIWYMVAAMHLPNLLYIWLAVAQPDVTTAWGLTVTNAVIGIESFGYGFGFAAFLMVMIMAADGPFKTAHYALCTGFMALGMMIPGMWSGYLAELVGYPVFFSLVMVFTIPGLLFIPFLPIDPDFGRRRADQSRE